MLAAGAATAATGVSVVEELAEFTALREEWNGLLVHSDADCIFLTWEWLHTWWKHLAGNRRLKILTVRIGGSLAGILPVCSRPFGLSWPAGDLWEFLGSGQAGSDYLDVIARRGQQERVCAALAAHFESEQHHLRWTNLSSHAAVSGIVARLAERGFGVNRASINICPYIPLTGHTWDSYLAQLGPEHRYQFRRKWRQLHRDFSVCIEAVTDAAACREAVDLLIRLHRMRWQTRGGSDAFHLDGLVELHREFASLALQRGWLRLFTMKLNGRPAASLYGFCYGRKFYYYQAGFDPAFEKNSVGLLLMAAAIQRAIDDGCSEFDMLHGDERYKSHWARESRELIRYELYAPGLGGRLLHSAMGAAREYRRVVRRVLSNSQ